MTQEDTVSDELYEHRADPDEWSEEPTKIAVKPRTEVVSFRLPREDLDRLEASLQASGETLSEFIRTAIAMRLGGAAPTGPVLEVHPSAGMAVSLIGAGRAARTEAPLSTGSWIEDVPPTLVALLGQDR